MRTPANRLALVLASAACLLALTCSEAAAQRSGLLEFGPEGLELQPIVTRERRGQAVPAARLPARVPEGAASWRPWALSSARILRLPAPPDERATAVELRELKRLMAGDDAERLDRIRYWDVGGPAHRWNEMLMELQVADVGREAGTRPSALLATAVHDALIAAWDSKYAYNRRRPSEESALVVPEVVVPRSPSYPCEHAVTAAATAAVLAHLFPAHAGRFAAAAHEAAWSRVMAGAAYPSDVRAGLELGRLVAAQVLEHAKAHDVAEWAQLVPVISVSQTAGERQ